MDQTKIESLRKELYELITMDTINDAIRINKMIALIDPISLFIQNPIFVQNIQKILDILIKDMDGNNVYDVNDLALISKDPVLLSRLVLSIFIVINSIPTLKITYQPEATEELIFKLLTYAFLVLLPEHINKPLSLDDKKTMLDIIFDIYQYIVVTQMSSNIIATSLSDLKTNGGCKFWCCGSPQTPDDVVDNTLSKLQKNVQQTLPGRKSPIPTATVEIKGKKKEIKGSSRTN